MVQKSLAQKLHARRRADGEFGPDICNYDAQNAEVPPACIAHPGMSFPECQNMQKLWATRFSYCCPQIANVVPPVGGFAITDANAVVPHLADTP